MGSNFPKDEIGSYITLRILKDMPNGDCVQIHLIRTNHLALRIPPDVITKKINNSIDFLRHADETRFSNFLWDILGKLRHFSGRMIPETKLIPKVD